MLECLLPPAARTASVVAILSFVLGVLLSQARANQSVSLAWDPNPEPDVAGYRVYYGAGSGSYAAAIDAGNATTLTVPDLMAETTYYFAVTAYNTGGLESAPSAEVVYTVPPVVTLAQWREENFTAEELNDPALEAAVWGTLSDPDGDNVSNLLEYAFGLDPRSPNKGKITQSSVEPDGSAAYPAITFTRPLSAQDLRYVVQVTDDLATWRNGSLYEGATVVPSNAETTELRRTSDGTMETITVRANMPVAAGTAQSCFLRVHVIKE